MGHHSRTRSSLAVTSEVIVSGTLLSLYYLKCTPRQLKEPRVVGGRQPILAEAKPLPIMPEIRGEPLKTEAVRAKSGCREAQGH